MLAGMSASFVRQKGLTESFTVAKDSLIKSENVMFQRPPSSDCARSSMSTLTIVPPSTQGRNIGLWDANSTCSCQRRWDELTLYGWSIPEGGRGEATSSGKGSRKRKIATEEEIIREEVKHVCCECQPTLLHADRCKLLQNYISQTKQCLTDGVLSGCL